MLVTSLFLIIEVSSVVYLVFIRITNAKNLHLKQRDGAGSSRDILRQQFYWIISGFAFCILYEIQFNNTIFLIFCKSQEPSYEAERWRWSLEQQGHRVSFPLFNNNWIIGYKKCLYFAKFVLQMPRNFIMSNRAGMSWSWE